MTALEWLNAYVRFVAFLERVGNALGTLAVVWATVVVLGGFVGDLGVDFGFATVIVFLESFRAFSRESMADDQMLFRTTGGIRLKRVSLGSGYLYYVNAVIMTVCLCFIPVYVIIDRHIPKLRRYHTFIAVPLLALATNLRFYQFIQFLSKPESPKLLQLSPLAALLAGFAALSLVYSPHEALSWSSTLLFPQWFIVYLLAKLPSPGAAHRFRNDLITVAVEVFRVISLASIVCTLSTWWHWQIKATFSHGLHTSYLLMLVGLLGPPVVGNLQTLVALTRMVLSCMGLFYRSVPFSKIDNTHLVEALLILYIMVLCQGILYMAACVLESCSSLPRRSLALHCGLVDTLGWESVNLYYEQAYDKFLRESVFDAKEINLVTFVVHSLSWDISRDKKLPALRILHSFFRQEASDLKTTLISQITTSTKAITSLISMLGWTVPEVAETRLLAAKVTAHLAPHLRVVGIPGTMQMVSTLLDAENQEDISALTVHGSGGNPESSRLDFDIEEGDSHNQQTRRACTSEVSSRIRGFWHHLNKLRSIPHAGSKGVVDSLPALGMQILEGLAHDPDNCTEISTATELLPKIIGSISCTTNITTPQQKQIVTTASLKLVAKLASVKGKVGIVLRQELSENPFLLSNLAVILEDSSSSLEQLKPTIDTIAKLAMDGRTRQEIGRIQVIIDRLVQGFLGRDETLNTLRTAAGEALAMLAVDCADNCSAILDGPENNLMGVLKDMLQDDKCLYPAASLLQSLCANCSHRGQRENLTSTLQVVLVKIMEARGKQMEALIGLASEICKIMPECITPALGSRPTVEEFVHKLVGELDAHKKPSPEFPNMRRVLVELTISMVESCPRYAYTFRECGMMDALSKVESTHSKVERYRVFFGSVGVVSEGALPLPVLVTRAKELVKRHHE